MLIGVFVSLAGGDGEHAEEMQVPWHLRELPTEDMLAGDTRIPARRLAA